MAETPLLLLQCLRAAYTRSTTSRDRWTRGAAQGAALTGVEDAMLRGLDQPMQLPGRRCLMWGCVLESNGSVHKCKV